MLTLSSLDLVSAPNMQALHSLQVFLYDWPLILIVLWFRPFWFLHSLPFLYFYRCGKGFSTRGWPKGTGMRNDRLHTCLDVSLCLQWHVAEVELSSDLMSWPTWESLTSAAQLLWLHLYTAKAFELNEGWMAFTVGVVCSILPKLSGLLRICALQGCRKGWLCLRLALSPRAR